LNAQRHDVRHQDKNLPGADMPPGHPEWHLPPANTPVGTLAQAAARRRSARSSLEKRMREWVEKGAAIPQ
jgi:hypothetical protein